MPTGTSGGRARMTAISGRRRALAGGQAGANVPRDGAGRCLPESHNANGIVQHTSNDIVQTHFCSYALSLSSAVDDV